MTEQERLKTDTVFVDTVIRECALMTIQKEADAQRIAELEERLDAVSANPPAEPSALMRYQPSHRQSRPPHCKGSLTRLLPTCILLWREVTPARYAAPSAPLEKRIASRYGAERQVANYDLERTVTALLSQP